MFKRIHDAIKLRLTEGNVNITSHALCRMLWRNFTDEDIKSYLSKTPVKIEKQEKYNPKRYKLIYEYNNKKDLIMIVNFGAYKLNIITVYLQDIKRR